MASELVIPRENSIWVDASGRKYRAVMVANVVLPKNGPADLRRPVTVIYQVLGRGGCLALNLEDWFREMKPGGRYDACGPETHVEKVAQR